MTQQISRLLSHQVAQTIGSDAEGFWCNAWHALESTPGLEDAVFVEGWAVTPDSLLIVEHGWLELGDQIVDPARWDRGLAYFPAVKFDKAQALDACLERDELAIVWRNGAGFWDHPAYHDAWLAAMAYIRAQLAARKRYRFVTGQQQLAHHSV